MHLLPGTVLLISSTSRVTPRRSRRSGALAGLLPASVARRSEHGHDRPPVRSGALTQKLHFELPSGGTSDAKYY